MNSTKNYSFLMLLTIMFLQLHGTVFLDTHFGVSGLATITNGVDSTITDIATQADDKIVVLGMNDFETSPTIFLARLTAQGALDTTFNTSGIVILQYGTNVFARSLAVQPNGKIVIAGYTIINDVPQLLIARYTSAGVLDTTFGSGGIVTQLINQNTTISAVALQTINQTPFILVAGQTFINQVPCGYIARYDDQGSLDTTFGTDGVVTLQHGQAITPAALEVQNDSKILLAGSVLDDNQKIVIARYTSEGVLDNDFGNQGRVIISAPGSDDDSIAGMLVQADGAIVLVGRSQIDGVGAILIIRYSGQGVPDEYFGIHGISTTTFDSEAHASSVSIKSDGTYVISASIGGNGTLLHYVSNGTLDTTFGVDGLIKSTLTSAIDSYPSLLSASQKIILGGSVGGNGVIACYRADSNDFVDITSPADGSTVTTSTILFSGRSSQANSAITIKNGTTVIATATTDNYGNWNAETSSVFPNGTYVFTVELVNGGIVVASHIHTITINASTDTIAINSPAIGSTITTATPTISGTSSQGGKSVKVSLDGSVLAMGKTRSSGSWRLAYPSEYSAVIPSGAHVLTVDLMDGTTILATTSSAFTSSVVSSCSQITMVGGTFLTSNPPVTVSGSGVSCPPVCDFLVRRINANSFEVTLLPTFTSVPLFMASTEKSATDGASVSIKSTESTNKVIFTTTGKPNQISFMATSCRG
jgi:uncharacterized delta-60 repeat protein